MVIFDMYVGFCRDYLEKLPSYLIIHPKPRPFNSGCDTLNPHPNCKP